MQRNTVQKDIIYSALCKLGNHPTAESVYDEVHRDHPAVSRATVYRVLNQMADNGSVLRIGMQGGADRFDHTVPAHGHFRCLRCRKLMDIPGAEPTLDELLTAECGEFEVTGFSLVFEGICPECRKAERARE